VEPTDRERAQPQAVEAEASVLGAMLLEKEAIGRAVELLDETCFYLDSHRVIFSAIAGLYDKGVPADLVTVTEELRKKKQLDKAGGASYLSMLLERVATGANVEYHARIVLEKAMLRKLVQSATNIVQRSYEGTEEIDKLLDDAESMVFGIRQSRLKRGFVPIGTLLTGSFEAIEELYRQKKHITGLETGFTDLDNRTSGFQKSDFIVVASRPSMGKTSLALNVAQHAAIANGVPVGIFSLEMSKDQLVQRMLCSEGRVDAQRLRTGYLAESDWPKLTAAAGRLREAPIYIDDSAVLSIWELKSKARRLKSEADVGVLMIDYLQLVAGPNSENRQQEISAVSRSLKALAKELEIPIIAMSQLSRQPEARGGSRRPMLSDLRESGAIEQDADVVVLIYRPELYDMEPKGVAEIIVAKQRSGPTGTEKLTFKKEYTRFENMSAAEEPSRVGEAPEMDEVTF
jgi:replicative DNA helicase